MKNEKKDLLSVEDSKPNETSDILSSITDNSIAQNIPKLEDKVINIPCKDRISTTKMYENNSKFFKSMGISNRDDLITWAKEKNYIKKDEEDKNYMATEWSEMNGYAYNQKNVTIQFETVLLSNNFLGYIPTYHFHSDCGYFTQKGIDHIKNELEKERRQENEY